MIDLRHLGKSGLILWLNKLHIPENLTAHSNIFEAGWTFLWAEEELSCDFVLKQRGSPCSLSEQMELLFFYVLVL